MLLFAFASRSAFTLFSCLTAAATAASYGQEACGENEVRACLPCNEPSCSVPHYSDEMCYDTCHLGCGCKYGHVRRDDTGKCVSMFHCDKVGSQANSK